jgi:hypothetical protein
MASSKFREKMAMTDVRLGPNAMFRFAFYNIVEALDNTGGVDKWIALELAKQGAKEVKDEKVAVEEKQVFPIQVIGPDDHNVCAVRFNFTDRSSKYRHIVLMTPAADGEIKIGENDGAINALNKVLEKIKILQADDKIQKRTYVTYVIPLAESRGRNHWTSLVISGNHYQFYDPRSGGRYDLTPMHGTMLVFGFKHNQSADASSYLGIQSLFNDRHCGHYTGWFMGLLARSIFYRTHVIKTLKAIKKESRHILPSTEILEQAFNKSGQSPEFQKYVQKNDAVWGALGHSTAKDITPWSGDDPQEEEDEFKEGLESNGSLENKAEPASIARDQLRLSPFRQSINKFNFFPELDLFFLELFDPNRAEAIRKYSLKDASSNSINKEGLSPMGMDSSEKDEVSTGKYSSPARVSKPVFKLRTRPQHLNEDITEDTETSCGYLKFIFWERIVPFFKRNQYSVYMGVIGVAVGYFCPSVFVYLQKMTVGSTLELEALEGLYFVASALIGGALGAGLTHYFRHKKYPLDEINFKDVEESSSSLRTTTYGSIAKKHNITPQVRANVNGRVLANAGVNASGDQVVNAPRSPSIYPHPRPPCSPSPRR